MSDLRSILPTDRRHLLEQPLYGHLGTIRPDGTVQVNPMWFEFDGEHVRFTHTTKRQKFRNLQHNPSMALSIVDPDEPTRYLEVAGRLVEVVPDPTAPSMCVWAPATATPTRRHRRQGRPRDPRHVDRARHAAVA
jgi:PPOX class probable F420-dependent enzyme